MTFKLFWILHSPAFNLEPRRHSDRRRGGKVNMVGGDGEPHPYVPRDLKLPGYVPVSLYQSTIVGVYLLASLLVVSVVWFFSGDFLSLELCLLFSRIIHFYVIAWNNQLILSNYTLRFPNGSDKLLRCVQKISSSRILSKILLEIIWRHK